MNCNESSRKPARLPSWLKKRFSCAGEYNKVTGLLDDLHLCTVCSAAHCPNRSECYGKGTATFMIMGEICTRGCRFCAVPKGIPAPLREDEPQAIAQASERMGLKYVVITSVTRDDLPDGGAEHFARTITALREKTTGVRVEVLTPDFLGSRSAIDAVLAANPDVFDHNLETVERLYEPIRPAGVKGHRPSYSRSLDVLSYVAGKQSRPRVKSGLMLGAGETDDETNQALRDLRKAGVEILTLGQYLAPSANHWRVDRYVEPARFEQWRELALKMGFSTVFAGPFVRSSYRAQEVFEQK